LKIQGVNIKVSIVKLIGVAWLVILGAITSMQLALTGELTKSSETAVQLQLAPRIWFLTLAQLLLWGAAIWTFWAYQRQQAQVYAAQQRNYEAQLKATHQAESTNRGKSQFLANMSYELRTPFNAMLGVLSLLDKTQLDLQQQDLIETTKNSAEHLLRLLNDILEVSALEAGKLNIHSEPVDMAALLQDVYQLMRCMADQKNLAFHLDGDVHTPQWVATAPTRVRQILYKLLSNAIQYTESGSIHIDARVKLRDKHMHWTIDVKDTGVGMSAETLSTLFQNVPSNDMGLNRSGLGLEISRALARLMGGDLTVTSRLGHGSCFCFEVVMLQAAPPEAQVPQLVPVLVADEPDRAEPQVQEPLQVLVAEDHPINRKVVGMLLNTMGHQVTFAEDGLKALELARSQDFDVVLMDIHMPEMDGLTSTRHIRELPTPRSQVPIVALTADVMNDAEQRAMDAGMNAFLSKPLQKAQLQAVLPRGTRTKKMASTAV
jgi:signal transduction histidine kinase/ActR/RegA family two-component response regulator